MAVLPTATMTRFPLRLLAIMVTLCYSALVQTSVPASRQDLGDLFSDVLRNISRSSLDGNMPAGASTSLSEFMLSNNCNNNNIIVIMLMMYSICTTPAIFYTCKHCAVLERTCSTRTQLVLL